MDDDDLEWKYYGGSNIADLSSIGTVVPEFLDWNFTGDDILTQWNYLSWGRGLGLNVGVSYSSFLGLVFYK